MTSPAHVCEPWCGHSTHGARRKPHSLYDLHQPLTGAATDQPTTEPTTRRTT